MIIPPFMPGECECCICGQWKEKKGWDHELQGFLCAECVEHDLFAHNMLLKTKDQ